MRPLPRQIRFQRRQSRLCIVAADLVDALELIRFAAQRRLLHRLARPYHKDLAGSLATCQVIDRGIVDLMPVLKRCDKLRIVTEHAP